MALFQPPFAATAAKREPTPTEQAAGFPCEVDKALLNGMFHRSQAETRALLDAAAISGDPAAFDNVLRAVNALIANKIPDAVDPSGFLSSAQLQARLPIHADVQTASGRIAVTSPSNGTVRLVGGETIMHRGVNPVTVPSRDFATSPSKTYHLRWRAQGGWALLDLADAATYNGGGLPEIHRSFDTDFDDVLVARVVTSAANAATITRLANAADLRGSFAAPGTNPRDAGRNFARFDVSWTWDWGRVPRQVPYVLSSVFGSGVREDSDRAIYARGDYGGALLDTIPATRYGASVTWMEDFAESLRVLTHPVA